MEYRQYIKILLNSCLRFLRYLQFESATLRGPLMSDASQQYIQYLSIQYVCALVLSAVPEHTHTASQGRQTLCKPAQQ